MNQIKQAFTLVELIVVVTILAILATIGFVSYSGYLTGVRDTNRVASLTAISDGLELYRTKNDLPLPDDSVEVQVESETIARQGYAGSNVLQTIEYSKAGKDPKDDQYYSYYLTDDKKHYQMMAFLEESDNLETNLFSQVKAATDYSNRHAKVYGKRLGILTDSNNTPIQEISTIKTDGNLNIMSGATEIYKVYFSDVIMSEQSSENLVFLKDITTQASTNPTSCKESLSPNTFGKNGLYTITISGNKTEVYCDMSRAGGGWTLIGNWNREGLDYTSGSTGSVSISSTVGWKMSDIDINTLMTQQAMFEAQGIGSYKEYLYCKKWIFDYSDEALSSGQSKCLRVYDKSTKTYYGVGSYAGGYVVSHWLGRDVWLRDNNNAATRWQYNNGKRGEFSYYHNSDLASPDIKMYVK